ncbi:unnamed protein product, partial [Urochloa humidicola]
CFFRSLPSADRRRNRVLGRHPHHPFRRPLRSLRRTPMSALFNFHSFVTVVLLLICTCTYLKMHFPSLLIRRTGFRGFFWKAARIGERLSPWVAIGCSVMGISILFW